MRARGKPRTGKRGDKHLLYVRWSLPYFGYFVEAEPHYYKGVSPFRERYVIYPFPGKRASLVVTIQLKAGSEQKQPKP